jgi:transposase
MRHALRDDQWEKIKDALPGKPGDQGRTAADNRLFVEAVMWVAKTGAPWRDLPPECGKWSCIHKRLTRWAKNGVWQMIFNTLAVCADTEWLMIDSTIVRAHQHSAGGEGEKNRPSAAPRAGSARRYTSPRTSRGAPCTSS